MKKLFKVILIVFIVVVIIGSGALLYITKGLESGKNLSINKINLEEIEDGIYKGRYEAGRWSNEVEVEIVDNRINSISIVDDIMLSQPEVREEVFKRVLDKQNLNVDIISEATVTTKAYLKSIEVALN